jgi:pyruvate/2-oxoglutarate dehydrogenase complex dihydrolipoamide acyltransferase (E2) component
LIRTLHAIQLICDKHKTTDHFLLLSKLFQVSVDVRAPEAGTLAAYHAALQETVKVGANLFTLSDSPATVTSNVTTPSPTVTAPPKAPITQPTLVAPPVSIPAPAPLALAQKSHSAHRRPAIHFRHGKRESIDAETGLYGSNAGEHTPADTSSYEAELEEMFPSKAGAKNFLDLPPMFGRPLLTVVESAMITSGGSPYEPPPPPAGEKKSRK